MPSDAASIPLRDTAYHIDLAAHFATGLDAETFSADLHTVYAVSDASRSSPKHRVDCRMSSKPGIP